MKLTLFRRLCLVATLVALCVIVLGAWVRLTHAGLGCPDWPGCYGHLTVGQALQNTEQVNAAFPDRPLEAGKALRVAHFSCVSGDTFSDLVLITCAVPVRARYLLTAKFDRKSHEQAENLIER